MILTEQTNPPRQGQAQVTGLDIAAIICALLVPPVGLILGLISRSSSKRIGGSTNILATASIVVGSVICGLAVIGAVITGIVLAATVSSVTSSAELPAECSTLRTPSNVLSQYSKLEIPRTTAKEDWIPVIDKTREVTAIAKTILQDPSHDSSLTGSAERLSTNAGNALDHFDTEVGLTSLGQILGFRLDISGVNENAAKLASDIQKLCPAS